MPSSSSTNRSASIPSSFERFRIRSFHFISLFSSSSNKISTAKPKPNIERSCPRKTKVQPQSIETSSQKLNPSAAHLFYAHDVSPTIRSYSLTEDLYRSGIEQNRTYSKENNCPTEPMKLVKTTNQAWQCSLTDLPCPSTPLMIHYRRDSLPIDVPKRFVPLPQTRSTKNNDIEQIDSN